MRCESLMSQNGWTAKWRIAAIHLLRLSDFCSATSGLQPFTWSPTNCIIRLAYAGPTACWLPCRGTMSSRMSLRREYRTSDTIVDFGSGSPDGSAGTRAGLIAKNSDTRSASDKIQASISRTAILRRISREGWGSQRRRASEGHGPSPSRSMRTTQCRNFAEWL